MDAATAAAMSDPERNPAFRRRWRDAGMPPQPPTPKSGSKQDAFELTGHELLKQWRQDRMSHRGVP
jgi:hypothetical protein